MTRVVLVVDDEPDHRALARLTLRLGGYEVREAASGEEAEAAIGCRRPDALVLDVRLPDIDGLTLLARIRSSERFASLPVLLCSAHAPAESAAAGHDPFTGFLAKPFHPDDLLVAVGAVLASPEEARQ